MSAKLAILGAGHGGQGLAAYLALNGHDVNLYNRSKSKLRPIQKQNEIHVEGEVNGFGQLARCTSSIKHAISDVDFVFVWRDIMGLSSFL